MSIEIICGVALLPQQQRLVGDLDIPPIVFRIEDVRVARVLPEIVHHEIPVEICSAGVIEDGLNVGILTEVFDQSTRVDSIMPIETPAAGAVDAGAQRCEYCGDSADDVEMHGTDAML